ncbi:MAG: hypothetical protein E6Q97_29355 [Desulfurellales bacterium]|nr:MAG: hypothetical protein E6Q97_29355 [Desulfurellales bacterium]
MMKTAVVVIAAAALAGCPAVKQPELQKPVLQANLLQPCPELTEHNGGKDGGSLLATLLEWAGQYHECAARQKALVEAVKP